MTIREYLVGENLTHRTVINRPWEDLLIGSGLLADGTDFQGFLKTLSGPVDLGTDVDYYSLSTAKDVRMARGTFAAPITDGSGPIFKISRIDDILESAMPSGAGAANPGNAGLLVSAWGKSTTEAQACAIYGAAITESTQSAHNDDALGISGHGDVRTAGTGYGIGGYFEGRRSTDTGSCNGLEARSANYTATDAPYTANGASRTIGVWATAGGQTGRLSSVAFAAAGLDSCQWDVGIGFPKISGFSPIKTATFRDDTDSVNSIAINGTHTVAVAVSAGAGPVIIGGTANVSGAVSLLEVQGPNSSLDPLVMIGSVANTQNYRLEIRNTVGRAGFAIVGGAGSFLTGTVAGDAILRNQTSGKMLHLGGTTKVLTVTQDNKLGCFAVTPVAQQAANADTSGATLAALETEVNEVKQLLRNYGLMA